MEDKNNFKEGIKMERVKDNEIKNLLDFLRNGKKYKKEGK